MWIEYVMCRSHRKKATRKNQQQQKNGNEKASLTLRVEGVWVMKWHLASDTRIECKQSRDGQEHHVYVVCPLCTFCTNLF